MKQIISTNVVYKTKLYKLETISITLQKKFESLQSAFIG